MEIKSSVISMLGATSSQKTYEKQESLKVWSSIEKPQSQPNENQIGSEPVVLELSNEAKNNSVKAVADSSETEIDISDRDKQKILILEELLRKLTGKNIKILIPRKLKVQSANDNLYLYNTNETSRNNASEGWGLIYQSHEYYEEKEKLSFSAEGKITTGDGKEINISVQLNMSREFIAENNLDIRLGDAKKVDPLVINFGGAPPELTDTKYSFDLDVDGTPEQISFVSKQSGFLAIDLNNDGIINNGSELLGPNTGNGFNELAKYDEDKNNWIDSNDKIFDKLRIWVKDENGNDTLFALGQKGIGAIYLGSIDTYFEIKDSENNSTGSISETGLYLKENGKAGTIQHIDLVV